MLQSDIYFSDIVIEVFVILKKNDLIKEFIIFLKEKKRNEGNEIL